MSFPATARPYVVGLTPTAEHPLQRQPFAPGADESSGDDDSDGSWEDEEASSGESEDSEEENARNMLAMRAFGPQSKPARDLRSSAWRTEVEKAGLSDRVAVLPVPTGLYSHLRVIKGPTLAAKRISCFFFFGCIFLPLFPGPSPP